MAGTTSRAYSPHDDDGYNYTYSIHEENQKSTISQYSND